MNRHPFRNSLYGLVAIAVLVAALPTVAIAQTEGDRPGRDNPVVSDENRPANLDEAKARVTMAIEKRLEALDRLTGKIDDAAHLSDNHGASLLNDIAAAGETLRIGLNDVEAAGTLEELREIAPAIFENTLVFALLAPKTHEVIASDAVGAATGRFTEFAARLQEALDRLAEAGVDTTGARASLDEMSRLIAAAATAAVPVAGSVIGLQPPDWPEPAQAALREGRAALEQARSSLREAHALAKEIVEFIRASIPHQEEAAA